MNPSSPRPSSERALLGLLLQSPESLGAVQPLEPEHFESLDHGRIFSSIRQLCAQNVPVDPGTIQKALAAQGETFPGAVAYLSELLQAAVHESPAHEYAAQIREGALRRQLAGTCEDIAKAARAGEDGLGRLLREAERRVFQLGDAHRARCFQPARLLLDSALARLEEVRKAPVASTGLRPLDDLLGGVRPGELILLKGTAGVGKTAMALRMAARVALEEQEAVGVVAPGADECALLLRLLVAESAVDRNRLRAGRLDPDEALLFDEVTGRARKAPLYVDCCPERTILAVRSRALRLKQEEPTLALLLVDGVADFVDGRGAGELFKRLAVELNACVIALGRIDQPRPATILGDLEGWSDAVIGLSAAPGVRGEVDVDVVGRGSRSSGTFRLRFRPGGLRFECLPGSP